MKKNDLFKLAQDPRFIPGIFNYCDRWCDRCPLTSRCLNYALELEQFGPPGRPDQPNEAFWKKFEDALKDAAELIMELGKEQGIDLSQVEVSTQELEPPSLSPRHEPLFATAKACERLADEWFESHTRAVRAKGDELMQQFKLGVADPEREAALIFNAVEVIRWYQPFIRVKLARATEQETRSAGAARDLQSDVNGSVKAALIAMDRSLAAWIELGRCLPEDRDDTLPVLARLDRLRRETEKAFPLARQFRRPGFDDPVCPENRAGTAGRARCP